MFVSSENPARDYFKRRVHSLQHRVHRLRKLGMVWSGRSLAEADRCRILVEIANMREVLGKIESDICDPREKADIR